MRKLLTLVLITISIGCSTLHKEYVEADRATLDLFGPKIEKWLEQEPGVALVNSESVGLAKDTLTSWESRVKRAEQALGLGD